MKRDDWANRNLTFSRFTGALQMIKKLPVEHFIEDCGATDEWRKQYDVDPEGIMKWIQFLIDSLDKGPVAETSMGDLAYALKAFWNEIEEALFHTP